MKFTIEEINFLDDIPWSQIWHIIKDIIIPYSGTLIFNIILFIFIGFILSIAYVILLSKKKIFKRKPRYYNWAVKLYIPLLIIGFLYIFGQWGTIRGVHKILQKEESTIVAGIYTNALGLYFESEESKNKLLNDIQAMAIETKDGSIELTLQLKTLSDGFNTGYTLIDKSKNGISNYIIDNYGESVYKIALYGMLSFAGAHANINDSLSYDNFSAGMDFLLSVGHEDIELAIIKKLTNWIDDILTSQYHGMVKSLLILLLILMMLPLIDFFIYKKWIEKKWIKNNTVPIKN